jgi:hypothetical protein
MELVKHGQGFCRRPNSAPKSRVLARTDIPPSEPAADTARVALVCLAGRASVTDPLSLPRLRSKSNTAPHVYTTRPRRADGFSQTESPRQEAAAAAAARKESARCHHPSKRRRGRAPSIPQPQPRPVVPPAPFTFSTHSNLIRPLSSCSYSRHRLTASRMTAAAAALLLQ